MRELITNDIYTASQILGKLDLKINPNTESDEEIFADLALRGAGNLHLAKEEINNFLGELCGMTGEEFGKLPIRQSKELIKEFKQLDGVRDFFESVAVLMNSEQTTSSGGDTTTSTSS